ncbi:pyrimidine/purine nucleotide monophosphate nucleosidase domain-containing protein [Desulfovibrio inopinatus]|uniref:pyrimidine/purine nucleotide monophosphate nucleosidase domain-containing protein n=1 Tax=Desulfovibrio inopinatus TaxID=102109 RepID=UPI000414FB50|nr:pyrimidine/purine nucleotide monophosphate nucleosidase domain-containing protein [Desulfovibrio inopinatus]
MKTELYLPLVPRRFGVREISREMALDIERSLADPTNRLQEMIAALINVHKADMNDLREIRHKFRGMTVELIHIANEYRLALKHVPEDCLYDGKNVIWESIEQISSLLRDMVMAPPFPDPQSDSAVISAAIKRFVEHAGFLYRGERGLVTFTWGGHRITREEYDFAKEVAYWLALFIPDIETITGCGAGIMKAPFKGSQGAYGKQRTIERFGPRDFIGFTEKNILAAEPPNEVVNRFLVFPNIEYRMEAFIRGAHRGRVHPGGVGTLEEILTMLAVLSQPENQGMPYAFDLVEREGGSYFKTLDGYLKLCLKDRVEGLYNIHRGAPTLYAQSMAEQTRTQNTKFLWNDELVFDSRLQHPFKVTFESMENNIWLSRDQSPLDLLIHMRRVFSAIVHLAIKDPDMLLSWKDERPRLSGDRDIVKATYDLIQALVAQRRIHPLIRDRLPFRIE